MMHRVMRQAAEKNGFYSNVNEKVSLVYTYGTDGAAPETDIYQEKPVVQVSDTQIAVTKKWENTNQNINSSGTGCDSVISG